MIVQKGCFAHRKREGIFLSTEYLKVYIKCLTLGKETGCCNTDLLLFGCREYIFSLGIKLLSENTMRTAIANSRNPFFILFIIYFFFPIFKIFYKL